MQMLKDLAIALSLANLCFLRTWGELFQPSNYYFMSVPPSIAFPAVILNVLLLAATFLVALNLARYSTHAYAINLARWAFLVVLFVPLNGIRQQFPPLANLSVLFGRTGFVILGLVLAIITVFVLLRWHRRVIRATSTIVLVLSPFILLTFPQAAWLSVKYDVTFYNKPLAASLTARKRSVSRVLWFLFDEMDQRITFMERPPAIKLPEVDHLRSQSLYASNAYPPPGGTRLSMPSLITGKLISKAQPIRPDEMMITFRGTKEAVGWSTQPNMFSKAFEAGFNTAVVGWYHPYCRVIGGSLTACSWEEVFGSTAGSRRIVLSETMLNQLYNLWPWRPRQYHIETCLRILKDAKKAVTDSKLGLILVHFPVPHKPYIYDRDKDDFTLVNYSISGYLDNLVLADRILGELRRTMETAGIWENTTVLLTSDHSWRSSALFDGKEDHRVPFILKLAGQKDGVIYKPAFNTIIIHDLLLAVLRGELSSPKSVVSWLDEHRSIIS